MYASISSERPSKSATVPENSVEPITMKIPSSRFSEVCIHQVARTSWHVPSGFDNQNDPDDYSCGSGVFWRYLLHGFNQNDDLRTEVLNLIAKYPETNAIFKSAQNPYAYAPWNHELFKEFNALSVLLTAIGILGQANG